MPLVLHSDASGLCYYLDYKPVRAGTMIEVLLDDKWLPVHYEWSGRPENDPYGLLVDSENTVPLKFDTPVRWPQE